MGLFGLHRLAPSCIVILAKDLGYFNIQMFSTTKFLQVYSLDWTSEKNRIVSASQDGRLIVWNALTSQKTHAIKLPCAWVMTCAFSPTGQSVACGGLDSVCSIFNLNKG